MYNDFNFKKKFGQNFLSDINILNKIVNAADITKDDLVIEIGPGSGAVTKLLLNKTSNIICFEIDEELNIFLDEFKKKGVTVVYEDFLKVDLKEYINNIKYNKLYIVSNLPYYITTPIIMKIINDNIDVDACVFMMQKEVGDRIKASPGNKCYNSLSIFIDYYFNVSKVCDVSRNVFYPRPNVDSIILLFSKRNDKKVSVKNENLFFELVKDAFTFKRKTLKNNLKKYDLNKIEKVLKKYDYDLNVRAEDLKIEIFAEISDQLS